MISRALLPKRARRASICAGRFPVRAGNVDGNAVSSDRRGGSHLYRTYGSRGSRHRNAAR
jgi:hypothetical protein